MVVIALALLWAISHRPCFAALWAAIGVLVSHRWLLDLHPLDWVGVPLALSRPLVLTLWLFCALAAAIFVGLWAWIGCRLPGNGMLPHALAMAAIWGIGELLLAKTPLYWVGVESALFPGPSYLTSLARLIGGGGLAVLLMFLGWWLWQLIRLLRKCRAYALYLLGLSVALVMLLQVLSVWLLRPPAPTGQLRLATWQPSVPTRLKFSKQELQHLPQRLQEALDQAAALGATALIAPEGTLLGGQDLAAPSPLLLLTGGFRWLHGEQRSSLLLILKGEQQPYPLVDKHRLVPLGEWLPPLPIISTGLSAIGGLQPGKPSRGFHWPGPAAAVAICYEISDGSALASAVSNGATWLLAIANLDPYPLLLQRQFLAEAALRAVESGRDLLSAANTGPSALVNSDGTVTTLVDPFREGVAITSLKLRQGMTPYLRWREGPLLLLLLIAIAGTLVQAKWSQLVQSWRWMSPPPRSKSPS